MNINAAFPGSYLKAADLQGKSVTIAMHSVAMEEMGGEHKAVLYFMDKQGTRKDRGLVLNKTNANIIAEMYGPETDEWHGQPITLMPARVEFSGRIVDAIRVRLETGTPVSSEFHAPNKVNGSRPVEPVTMRDDAIPF